MNVVLSLAAQLELADRLGVDYALIWRRPPAARLELRLARPGRPEHDGSLRVVGLVAIDEIAGDRGGLKRLAFQVADEPAVAGELRGLLADARTFVRFRHGEIARRAVELRDQLAAHGLVEPLPTAAA
jgi:hypothetical protein